MFEEEGWGVAVEERGGNDDGMMALFGGVTGSNDSFYAGVGGFDPGYIGGEILWLEVSPRHGPSLISHSPRGISV